MRTSTEVKEIFGIIDSYAVRGALYNLIAARVSGEPDFVEDEMDNFKKIIDEEIERMNEC